VITSILHEILFEKSPSEKDITLWCDASETMAGLISAKAYKTAKRTKIIHDAVNRADELSRGTKWYDSLVEILPDRYERVSCFLQPCLISPTINITDSIIAIIAVEKETKKTDAQTIIDCIAKNPPFPIFERWDSNDNCQYVIMADNLGENLKKSGKSAPNWISFGLGPRSCPGKQVALNIIENLNREWLFPLIETQKFDTETILKILARNHNFSGRHNDNQNDSSFIVQVCLVARVLYYSFLRNPYLLGNSVYENGCK